MPGTVQRVENSVVNKIFEEKGSIWGKSGNSLLNSPSVPQVPSEETCF